MSTNGFLLRPYFLNIFVGLLKVNVCLQEYVNMLNREDMGTPRRNF